jgi:Arm DNA-binding domain
MLTQLACRNLKPKAKLYKISDGGGLRLHVTTTGSKLWCLAYRFGGKQKELSFGPYPFVTIAMAREGREAAKRFLGAGIDPSEHRKAIRLQIHRTNFYRWALKRSFQIAPGSH